MSRHLIQLVTVLVLGSCVQADPKSVPSERLSGQVDAVGIAEILASTIEGLDAPWTFEHQDVVPIQVDGYGGSLPVRLGGKPVVSTNDAQAWGRSHVGCTALHLKIIESNENRVRVHAAATWGTGSQWSDAALTHESGKWVISQSYGGGYMF